METITNKKQASKFLGIKENEILNFCKYPNGDWKYCDRIKHEHLHRNIDDEWIELTKNVEALFDKDKYYCHLFRKIDNEYIELTKDINATDVWSYDNGDWMYEDEDGTYYSFNKNNELILKLKL